MKKVSVIITTYNSEKTIQNTLHSILNQDGVGKIFELEILVVDDCSTDRTREILSQNNISFLSTGSNSGGPNRGRNIALKKAKGDYTCVADHDDIWHKNKMISLLPYLLKVPIVSSGYVLIDKNKQKTIKRINTDARAKDGFAFYSKNETFLNKFSRSNSGQNTYLGSIIYRSELNHILFEEYFGVVDYDWVLSLFYNQESIEVCQLLYDRIVEGDNLSLNESYRRKDFYYSLMFIEKFSELYPKQYHTSYKKIHGSRARYYYFIGDMKKARFYLKKAPFTLKILLYYISSYFGSSFVKKHFNVFG